MELLGIIQKGLKLERVRYFARQLLTADDMACEQEYFLEKQRRHNRLMHGWGVVCGCDVEVVKDWQVKVSPGFVLDQRGNEIYIDKECLFDLKQDWRQPQDPCTPTWPSSTKESRSAIQPGKKVYLAVRYTECFTRPVRTHPASCSCNDTSCEYSRLRESFELARLNDDELETSYKKLKVNEEFQKDVKKWVDAKTAERPLPVPKLPELDISDKWVILATVTLPDKFETELKTATDRYEPGNKTTNNISYEDRQVVYSNTALQVWHGLTP